MINGVSEYYRKSREKDNSKNNPNSKATRKTSNWVSFNPNQVNPLKQETQTNANNSLSMENNFTNDNLLPLPSQKAKSLANEVTSLQLQENKSIRSSKKSSSIDENYNEKTFDTNILYNTIKNDFTRIKGIINEYIKKENFLSLVKSLTKRLETDIEHNILTEDLLNFNFKYSGYQSTLEIFEEINSELKSFTKIIVVLYERRELKSALLLIEFIEGALNMILRILMKFRSYKEYERRINEAQEGILVMLYEMYLNIHELKPQSIQIRSLSLKILQLKSLNSNILFLKNTAKHYLNQQVS